MNNINQFILRSASRSPTPLTRHGLKNINSSFVKRASFEQVVQTLHDAAVFNKTDTLSTHPPNTQRAANSGGPQKVKKSQAPPSMELREATQGLREATQVWEASWPFGAWASSAAQGRNVIEAEHLRPYDSYTSDMLRCSKLKRHTNVHLRPHNGDTF